MPQALIIDAVRTPVGRHGGALASVRPDDLAAIVLKALIERTKIDPAIVEEVYFGCANQAGEDNRNVARMALILAGFPYEVPAVTFNRLCASSLAAINTAARAIKVGDGEVFIAGGVESMSRAPWSFPKATQAFPFRQCHGVRYRAGLALSQRKDGSQVPARIDGRNGGEYLRASTGDHARRARSLCVRQPDESQSRDRVRALQG